MLNFLQKLVGVSSQSHDYEGVQRVLSLIAAETEALGGKQKYIVSDVEGYAPLLHAEWGDPELPKVLLVCHADTVYPQDHKIEFHHKDEKILGPGVVDNKGGVVVGLWALKKLLKENKSFKKHSISFLCSSCEEVGSPGFQNYFKELSLKASLVLGLEPALPDGSLIHARFGNRFYRIILSGNSVHTGRDFIAGANPVVGLSRFQQMLAEALTKHPQVTASINELSSRPLAANMSPASLEFTLDLRFNSQENLFRFHAELEQIFKKTSWHSPDGEHGGELSWSLLDDCPAFRSEITPTLEKIRGHCERREEKKVEFSFSRGASDCCYLARPGLEILDGLGPRGGALHSPAEFAEEASLERRASALAAFLDEHL